MRTNVRTRSTPILTHEGAPATRINAELQLRRTVMACLLWEKTFYEEGQDVVERIKELVREVKPSTVAKIAIEAREKMNLRHVPLLLVREMARIETYRPFVAEVLPQVIQRADEVAEFMALYWQDGRQPIAHSVRRGLDLAIRNFNEFELAKYKGHGRQVTLRDVLRMVRPKPIAMRTAITKGETIGEDKLWEKVVKGTLPVPDTWETTLSANDGIDKKTKWSRLLAEKRLGGLALLRNLRNMEQAGVDRQTISAAIATGNYRRVLPFRFIAAGLAAPWAEPALEIAMTATLAEKPKLPGHTIVMVDVSGSMVGARLSEKSDMDRLSAAAALAMIARELCEQATIFAFDTSVQELAPRRGFALRDLLTNRSHGGTDIGKAVEVANRMKYDRLIIITDEQSHTRVGDPVGKGYMINVATYRNGIGYGKWTHIDGFSEAIFQYIYAAELDVMPEAPQVDTD